MKQEWQVRQKHDTDVRETMQRLGFLRPSGEVKRFNGAEFWPEMEKAGHDSTRLEECSCWKERLSS